MPGNANHNEGAPGMFEMFSSAVRKAALFPLAALLFCGILSGCRSVPVTERSQLILTSESYENQLGAEAYAEYKQKYPRSTNARYNEALNRVGNAVKNVSGQSGFQWEFLVLESAEQNAFCLPGGKVAVYSGLMKVMKNEAELACVVAHEVGHAIARHGGERMSWAQLQAIGALGLAIGLENETVNGIYGTGTELGVMLPFSRDNEHEADRIGLLLMARAGYNPQASVQFWSRFGQGKNPSFLDRLTSTHPCDADRIANLKKHMPEAEAAYRKAATRRDYGVALN